MNVGSGEGQPTAGRFIVLVGPDGVGKTEVARELIRRLGGRYFHFRPPSSANRLLETPPSDTQPREEHTGRFPLGPVRLLRNFVLFWFGYLASVVPVTRSGTNVVGDRWAYGYLVQPTSLRYGGPKWLARLAIRALPSPDVVINLGAAPETVRGRKPELSLDELEHELEAWASLPVEHLISVDAEPPVSVIVDRLIDQILA